MVHQNKIFDSSTNQLYFWCDLYAFELLNCERTMITIDIIDC